MMRDPQYFRVTTRLAFEEAQTLDELGLVREPERRLYRELVAAGLRVELREDRPSRQPAYDIADLHLRFDVFGANGQKVQIRFDPAKGAFLGENQEWFRFEELIFKAERCMQRVRSGFNGALKPD
jgi:hypothetical protein